VVKPQTTLFVAVNEARRGWRDRGRSFGLRLWLHPVGWRRATGEEGPVFPEFKGVNWNRSGIEDVGGLCRRTGRGSP